MNACPFPYRTRRTIKPAQMDAGREVPHETLLAMLEDAHWAPTHGLTQPWRFQVFTGLARDRLAAALEEIYERITPEGEKREDKRAKLRGNVLRAPVAIAVAACVEPGGKISELDEIAATACAVQNLLLSAHQRGLGSFWSSAPAACSAAFRDWLKWDARHRCLGLIFLGHAAPGPAPISTRSPLAERVVFHSR